MFLLAYGYHSSAGFFNLCWLIFSFIMPTTTTLFMSIVVMIPMLSWEFIFIYCGRVPKIRETTFFQNLGKYFRFTMVNETIEQFFMLVTLLLFYMMISSYLKRIDNQSVENGLIRFFRQRISSKNPSMKWIWVFLSCRYAHILVLIFLFQRGVSNLDCVNNLGFLIFFVVYTGYEDIYRKTGYVLIFFTSVFILGQYFTSLFYQVVMDNDETITNMYWWNLFPNRYLDFANLKKDPFHIVPGEKMYGRCSPQLEDWINVMLMRALREINIMYTTEALEEYKLRQQAYHIIEEKTGKLGYYFNRFKKIFLGIFNTFVIIALVCVQYITTPSIITWLFFALNLFNLALMVKGSIKASEMKKQLIISNIIKFYSLMVIIANVFILAFNYRIDNDPEYKKLKQWLQVIGLKANELEFASV